jgi:hypothetical protein
MLWWSHLVYPPPIKKVINIGLILYFSRNLWALVVILFSTPCSNGCHLQIVSCLHNLNNYSGSHVNMQRFHVAAKEFCSKTYIRVWKQPLLFIFIDLNLFVYWSNATCFMSMCVHCMDKLTLLFTKAHSSSCCWHFQRCCCCCCCNLR